MMQHQSANSALYVAGIALTASWLATTVYLMRQNFSLRQCQQRALDDDDDNRSNKDKETDTLSSKTDSQFIMHEIGVIQSPFPQRAGCPRQGTLAPHVKSLLWLHPHLSPQVLDGILEYSHVWIIFQFHLNPRNKAKKKSNGCRNTFTASKVRPPRANGKKVGVLATRAPHRPNPVGLSLALLERTTVVNKGKRKQTCLVLRGLDLVDGTPVYDVKPFVPWDQIGCSVPNSNNGIRNDLSLRMTQLKVPSWVSADDDELARVTWTESAKRDLFQARQHVEPFYDNVSIEEACRAIEEIIAQDPRAMRDGRGKANNNEAFEFTFGQLRIQFVVDSSSLSDIQQQQQPEARIISILVDDGDISAFKGSYPYNLALRRAAERHARECHGTTLEWANPVREGVTEGLYDLTNGTSIQ
jgi:tRNA-Thr(GGU) m(6)t(6)A37 methyltransferase TsaA